ncbi:MAG: DedA family protein [Armatimonadota bacterium]
MEKLLIPILVWVKDVIAGWGYGGIVVLMAIESACIPLPSEVIMPFSGYLVSEGRFGLWQAALAGAVGCGVGSAVAYWVGATGGRAFFERYGRYVLVRRRDLDRADYWFAKYGEAAVFISRLLPVVRTFISLPAGIARMHFGRFMVYSLIGSFPWCYALAYVGLKMGQHWEDVRRYFHGADVVIGILLAVGFAFWLWHHLRPETMDEAEG